MNRLAASGILAIVGLSVLDATAPALVQVARAASPLVVVIGVVVGLLRVVWHFTNHY